MVAVRDHLYKDDPITEVEFSDDPTYTWCFNSHGLLFQNDSKQTISYSFDGKTVDGTITKGDKWLALDGKQATKVWLKTSVNPGGGSAFRFTAWRKEPS